MYIRQDLAFKQCLNLEPVPGSPFEALWVKIYLPQGSLIVGVFYSAPHMPATEADLFISYLDNVMHSLSATNYQGLVMIGDFNAKSKNWYAHQENNPLGSRLFNFVSQNGMAQLIKKPTRITANSKSLIDLIITNTQNVISDSFVKPPLVRCDHQLIGATFDFGLPSGSYTKSFYDLERTNIGLLQATLASTDWNSLLQQDSPANNVQQWVDVFHDIIRGNTNITTIRVRRNDKPWFKNNLKHVINVRHRSFRKAKLRNTEQAWAAYHRVASESEIAIRNAKQEYYQSLVDDLSELNVASKKWWNVVKNITGRKKADGIPFLFDNIGGRVFDDIGKCTLLNHFFADQSTLNDSDIPVPPVTPYTESTLEAISVTPADVLKVILSLNLSKATGSDGIGNKFIRRVLPTFTDELSKFFNYCLLHGVFPNQWKISNVIPIHKKGEKTSVSNYRPISLLPCLSKVFERLVANHMMKYITDNNLVSHRQSGFMPKDSTTS